MAKNHTIKQGKIPVKRNFNLAEIGRPKPNYTMTILVTLVLGILALSGVKVGIIDRLTKVAEEEAKVTDLQVQVDMMNAAIESFGDIATLYGHYTYSDMTPEEMAMVETMDVIELIEDNLIGEAVIGNWTLAGNVLTIPMIANNLQEVNALVQVLQASPNVDFCTVTTAKSVTEEVETVTAQVTVYLMQSVEEVE